MTDPVYPPASTSASLPVATTMDSDDDIVYSSTATTLSAPVPLNKYQRRAERLARRNRRAIWTVMMIQSELEDENVLAPPSVYMWQYDNRQDAARRALKEKFRVLEEDCYLTGGFEDLMTKPWTVQMHAQNRKKCKLSFPQLVADKVIPFAIHDIPGFNVGRCGNLIPFPGAVMEALKFLDHPPVANSKLTLELMPRSVLETLWALYTREKRDDASARIDFKLTRRCIRANPPGTSRNPNGGPPKKPKTETKEDEDEEEEEDEVFDNYSTGNESDAGGDHYDSFKGFSMYTDSEDVSEDSELDPENEDWKQALSPASSSAPTPVTPPRLVSTGNPSTPGAPQRKRKTPAAEETE